MIDRETIDRIRNQTSITALIGESVKLRKRGRSQVGLCPFHQEKTPSFNVDEERGFYHCFGCGVSGDVFTFVEQHEGLSFAEAVRRLAERAGITIEETASEPDRRREEEARRRRQALYDLGAAVATFYERMLEQHPLRGYAQAELERRGLVAGTAPDPVSDALQAFRIGYAPFDTEALTRHLQDAGLSLQTAQTMGVVTPRQSGGYLDRFRHRLMFPVLDLHGRVVGFIGRALEEPSEAELRDAGLEPMEQGQAAATHLGCPESPVYKPRQVVFGLHQARQSVRTEDQCVLVRSGLDALSMHAHGMKNAVSPLGSALSLEQALLIKRFSPRVTFLCGGDAAERRAVASAREICRQAELLAKVAVLPEGAHPDELLSHQGAEVIRRAVAAGRGLLEHLIDSALDSRFGSHDAETRAAKVGQVRQLLSSEPNPLVRAMAQQYADRVVGRLGVTGARTLRQLGAAVQRDRIEAERDHERGPSCSDGDATVSQRPDPGEQIGHDILGALLDYPQLLAEAQVADGVQLVQGEVAAAIASVRRSWDGQQRIEVESFLAKLAPDLRAFAQGRLDAPQHESLGEARAELLANLRRLQQPGHG